MPNITVKNIPEPIYEELKKRAKAQHRSINSEIIACLEQSTHSFRPSPEYFLRQAERIHKLAKGSISAEEIEAAINQGRP